MSVIDAAFTVGYGSLASFSRAFRKLFDVETNKVKLKQTPQSALLRLSKNLIEK
jgi:AraC-like DNA-binding protein